MSRNVLGLYALLQVEVQQTDTQKIRLDDLRRLGFVQSDNQVARLQLYRLGQPVALEKTGDRIRFYAPLPRRPLDTPTTSTG